MRCRLRALFWLTALAGLVLTFVIVPMIERARELRKLQELAAAKGGHVRVVNGRAVAIEFNGRGLTDADVAQINWERFAFKMVLLYQCSNVSNKAIDAMQLNR